MSTKNKTVSSNSYDPSSLSTYQNLQGPAASQLGQQITNPQNNSLINGLRNRGNAAAAGFNRGPNTPTSGSNAAAYGRATAGFGAQTNNALTVGGAQLRNQAIGAAMQYRPLQTGGTQTQSTYGVGTWAAPIIGAGLSLLGAPGQSLAKNAAGNMANVNANNFAAQGYAGSIDPTGGGEYDLGSMSDPSMSDSSDSSGGSDDVWGL